MGQITSLDRRGGKGTEIGRVRGLGSAHQGAGHWHLMHLTSAGSLVTCAYLVFSFVFLHDLTYPAMRAWLSGIVPSLALALLLVSVLRHTQLGLQTLIEDYVDSPGGKYAWMMVINLLLVTAAVFGLFCIARVDMGAEVDASAQQTKSEVQQSLQGMLQGMQGTPR